MQTRFCLALVVELELVKPRSENIQPKRYALGTRQEVFEENLPYDAIRHDLREAANGGSFFFRLSFAFVVLRGGLRNLLTGWRIRKRGERTDAGLLPSRKEWRGGEEDVRNSGPIAADRRAVKKMRRDKGMERQGHLRSRSEKERRRRKDEGRRAGIKDHGEEGRRRGRRPDGRRATRVKKRKRKTERGLRERYTVRPRRKRARHFN